jgi:ADP-dependent NAD(P)H-hydrate dehydratase / NAD(P)H-hydrate epimerase
MKIFTAKQMYEADQATESREGISPLDLMERASEQVFFWIDNQLKGARVPIHVFCGIGNNGGDGMAVTRMLLDKGYIVEPYVVNYSETRSKCFLINYGRLKDNHKIWPKKITGKDDFPSINPNEIVVDALFGIGLNRPLEGWLKDLVQHINKSKAFVLAIDVPSGIFIDAPTPDLEAVIKANVTLTFQAPKLVFYLPQTGVFSQHTEILDIGLDRKYLETTKTNTRLILKNDARLMYKPREKFGHKGSYGHALIAGGSYGKMGAVTLALKSCLRAGAGKASAFIPICGFEIIQTSVPEAMVITDPETEKITTFPDSKEFNAIGLGIGLGTDKVTATGFEAFLKTNKTPLVLDADALNLLAANKKLLKLLPKNSILTPHPGELERLVGKWKNDFDMLKKTKALSKSIDGIVVIKGAHTITVYHDQLYVNTTGNPGMATAGSGDVLTGIITGFLAQHYDPLTATIFGVYLHGLAGDLAAQQTGVNSLIAGDIVEFIGDGFVELFRLDDVVGDV